METALNIMPDIELMDSILTMSSQNNIAHIFHVGDEWCAYDRSLYFLSQLYPDTLIYNETIEDQVIVYGRINNATVLKILDEMPIKSVEKNHYSVKVDEFVDCSESIQWYYAWKEFVSSE